MNIHEINNLRNALDSVTKKEMEQRRTIKRLLLDKEDLKKQLSLSGVVNQRELLLKEISNWLMKSTTLSVEAIVELEHKFKQ